MKFEGVFRDQGRPSGREGCRGLVRGWEHPTGVERRGQHIHMGGNHWGGGLEQSGEQRGVKGLSQETEVKDRDYRGL